MTRPRDPPRAGIRKREGHAAQVFVVLGGVEHVMPREAAMELWREISRACDDGYLADLREKWERDPGARGRKT